MTLAAFTGRGAAAPLDGDGAGGDPQALRQTDAVIPTASHRTPL